MSNTDSAHELSDALEQLVENTEGEKISLGDLLDSLDSRSFGPLLLVIALIAISPIGAVPGMSLVTGTLIVILCAQIIAGRSHPWFPKQLLSIKFQRSRLEKTVDSGRPWAKWAETALHRRLTFLTQGVALKCAALVVIGLALTFYPLAVVPFGVLVPGLAVTMLALGVAARDGLLILIGYLGAIGAVSLLIVFWPF